MASPSAYGAVARVEVFPILTSVPQSTIRSRTPPRATTISLDARQTSCEQLHVGVIQFPILYGANMSATSRIGTLDAMRSTTAATALSEVPPTLTARPPHTTRPFIIAHLASRYAATILSAIPTTRSTLCLPYIAHTTRTSSAENFSSPTSPSSPPLVPPPSSVLARGPCLRVPPPVRIATPSHACTLTPLPDGVHRSYASLHALSSSPPFSITDAPCIIS
ncbi:hypothetical protein B0H19DRAFT_1275796 [Mycena capillaripes]|nr:hypothetical protein B0H19DRAFT_1275796 [Mycena capillaripes]